MTAEYSSYPGSSWRSVRSSIAVRQMSMITIKAAVASAHLDPRMRAPATCHSSTGQGVALVGDTPADAFFTY